MAPENCQVEHFCITIIKLIKNKKAPEGAFLSKQIGLWSNIKLWLKDLDEAPRVQNEHGNVFIHDPALVELLDLVVLINIQ